MPRLVATATGFPPHYYSQDFISGELQAIWAREGVNAGRVARLHAAATVEGRHIATEAEEYYGLGGWEAPNAIYLREGLPLAEAVLAQLFEDGGVPAEEVRLLAYATTTGLAIPTVDARLLARMPFRADTKRMPLFGLGCVAGAAGTARVADYLRGHPEEAAALLCQEFCSLTLQKHDTSVANIIACGLFGDATAGVLLVGDRHPLAASGGPEVLGSRSVAFPDSEHYMGWTIAERGMQLVLSADVPGAVESGLRAPLEAFLSEFDVSITDVAHWVCHPGGPRVMDAVEAALDLPPDALARSRRTLREKGNVSSVSVLLVLDAVLREEAPEPGSYGLMLAMGPGFTAEMVLLRW